MKKVILPLGAVVLTVAAVLGLTHGKAVDTAGAPVTPAHAKALKDSGATFFIQALTWWPSCSRETSQPSTRVDSLRAAQGAGLRIAGYLLLDSQSTGAEAVLRARNGMPQDLWDSLEFVAVDFEIPSECFTAGTRIKYEQLTEALDELERMGKPRVVYTSFGEWVSRMTPGNPPKPPRTYLWNASWDNDPDIDYAKLPFGGWLPEEVILEQYNGGTDVQGVYVDLNAITVENFPWQTTIPSVALPPEWGECDVLYGDCWHPGIERWVFPNGDLFDPKTNHRSVLPR